MGRENDLRRITKEKDARLEQVSAIGAADVDAGSIAHRKNFPESSGTRMYSGLQHASSE